MKVTLFSVLLTFAFSVHIPDSKVVSTLVTHLSPPKRPRSPCLTCLPVSLEPACPPESKKGREAAIENVL